jgi:hypothetical protein
MCLHVTHCTYSKFVLLLMVIRTVNLTRRKRRHCVTAGDSYASTDNVRRKDVCTPVTQLRAHINLAVGNGVACEVRVQLRSSENTVPSSRAKCNLYLLATVIHAKEVQLAHVQ